MVSAWYPKHPFFNGCFSWMIPNLYIKHGGFTKHPFKTGCLGFQVGKYIIPSSATNNNTFHETNRLTHLKIDGWKTILSFWVPVSFEGVSRGHYITNPKKCIVIREIPQNCHRFVLFDSTKMGPIY